MIEWVCVAASVPWNKLASDIAKGGLAPGDASHLFDWPFSRVVAVYLMDSVQPTPSLSDPDSMREWRNEQRKKKGLPPLKG